jgi:hypothetical protein
MSRDSRRPAVANTAVTVEVAPLCNSAVEMWHRRLGSGIGLGYGIRAVIVPVITVVALLRTRT